MYLFEENEYVIYKGDGTTLSESRRNPSLAIVNKIDEDKFPYVGLKLVPSGELIGAEARLVRNITTSEEALLKLGFQKTIVNRAEYYQFGDFIVVGIVLHPKPGHIYFAGFRHVPSIPLQFDATPLIKDGEVREDALEQLFPNMHNLNRLVKYLNENRLSNLSIQDAVNVYPFY
jgi:hypothetical protein